MLHQHQFQYRAESILPYTASYSRIALVVPVVAPSAAAVDELVSTIKLV